MSNFDPLCENNVIDELVNAGVEEKTGVEEETRKASDYGDLGFPELTILQVIFGRSSFAELRAIIPDVYHDNEAAAILFDILFPKKHSNVLGVVWPAQAGLSPADFYL